MENPVNTDWGLQPLHDKMLEMLSYIHHFCKQNGIEYCLAYGSALGAIRHKGFIPWDDDVDIYMTLDDYMKFRKAFAESGDKETYYLQELGNTGGYINYPKFRMNGTTFLENDTQNFDMHHGLYIDFFILHKVPNKLASIRKMQLASKYLGIKRLSNIHYSRRPLFKPLLSFIRLFPYDFGRKVALKVLYKYDSEDIDFYFESDYQGGCEVLHKDWIFPTRTAPFEGIELNIPAKAEEYLSNFYGNYMEIPSFDSIKWHQHSCTWSVDKDFKEVLNRNFEYKDEVLG